MLRRMAERPRLVAPPSIVVVGDLMLDVSIAPREALRSGTDVPGAVRLRQGGSAASTARWVARLGARSSLICAVGRDAIGRALVQELRDEAVRVRAFRARDARTGRIGVIVAADGERSFVADRGAADALPAEWLDPAWFAAADAVHLPAYSLLGEPLGIAGRRAAELARAAGARISVDLASAGPLLAAGRAAAQDLIGAVAPDLLLATESEAAALTGGSTFHDLLEDLLELAPLLVIKRGARGASVIARSASGPQRFEVPARPVVAADTTGAGDAFDAGFLVRWLAAPDPASMATLRSAARTANRTARRQLTGLHRESATLVG